MSRQSISCTNTAKLIRQALKEAFAGVKFSVRSHVYAGGASIIVEWHDGPNVAQVETVTVRFEASYFDGMIDYKGAIYHMLDGQPVRFGADFIRCNRGHSKEATGRAIARVYRSLAHHFEGCGMDCPTVEQYEKGELLAVEIGGKDLNREIRNALAKSSDRLAGKPSKTAGRVFVTHDDGYSRAVGSGMAAVSHD